MGTIQNINTDWLSKQNLMAILCTLCGKNFSSPSSLKKHTNNVHDDQKKTCQTCQKEIIGNKKYNDHLATHETITCNNCKSHIKKGSRGSHP